MFFNIGGDEMKFMEGLIIGGMVGTGITLMYTDSYKTWNSKKMIKKGKQFAKKLGIY